MNPERRSRKKSSPSTSRPPKNRSSSKKRPTSPSTPTQIQNHVAPAQTFSTPNVVPQHPYSLSSAGSPQNYPGYSASPLPHPVYGQMPQYPPQYGLPPQTYAHPAFSQSAVRFASPRPLNPGGEPASKDQRGRFDRVAALSYSDLRNGATKSVTKLTTNYVERPAHMVATKSMQTICRGAALCDIISSKFDSVLTSIDSELFSGKEQDLMVYENQPPQSPNSGPPPNMTGRRPSNDVYRVSSNDKGANYFSKVWLYSNSRLPPHLPPFKVYMPTYPLLCLAATYSERVYTPPGPNSVETETHVPSDWRSGTKAMVLKSVPVEDLNTIVFAIRGSQTFMDWAVNYNSDPHSPKRFLDDSSNLCHAGFLYVAKKMIKPVADRLRVLLQENPARSNCSLLITGHSAGGAVAALLYAHMMSTKVESDLNYLTGFFKRVHCITFGAPPVSIYPLQKPSDKRHRKSLFYSFINEGDPVPRADKGVVRSLLKLYASSAPSLSTASTLTSAMASKLNLSSPLPPSATSRFTSRIKLPRLSKAPKIPLPVPSIAPSTAPSWPIPQCSLVPAGRLIVLRPKPQSRNEDDVEAVTVDEELLKNVVYGDPLKHQMRVYRLRIENVAVKAVTARGA